MVTIEIDGAYIYIYKELHDVKNCFKCVFFSNLSTSTLRQKLRLKLWTGKSCFSNRVLVKTISEAPKCL